MNVFDYIKSKNIDELAEWLDEHCLHDFSPWYGWWDENYCHKCESIILADTRYDCKRVSEYSWCELNDDRCKYFKDMDEIPNGKQLVKMWLESEV